MADYQFYPSLFYSVTIQHGYVPGTVQSADGTNKCQPQLQATNGRAYRWLLLPNMCSYYSSVNWAYKTECEKKKQII